MKRLTVILIASAMLASILGGCIIAPDRGRHDDYYHNDRRDHGDRGERGGYYGR